MTPARQAFLPALACLLLTACAGGLRPQSSDAPPPPVAAPTQAGVVVSDELRFERGHRGNKLGAEVIGTEVYGDQQIVEVRIPLPPDEVDQVQVLSPSGEPLKMSRETEIIRNYEINNVGIRFQTPKTGNLTFRLKLIDNEPAD